MNLLLRKLNYNSNSQENFKIHTFLKEKVTFDLVYPTSDLKTNKLHLNQVSKEVTMENTSAKINPQQIKDAKKVIAYYTMTSAATGSVPVPAASAAIVAENGLMIAYIASKLGQSIDTATVISSIGIAGTLNAVGKTLFIEGAKLLSWGTGNIWALGALSAFGACTAGVQTYMIGMLAIEIGKNKGHQLNSEKANKVKKHAKNTYDSFTREWKQKKTEKPVF
jgi:uncharacterized protein (DUF697 family)